MIDRSDRDPPNLNVSWGLQPVRRMRSGSADFIGASGMPRTRPDIKLRLSYVWHRSNYLAKGRRPYNVNSWHSRFKSWLVRFRGVASRYLITFKMVTGLDAHGLTTPAHLLCAALQLA